MVEKFLKLGVHLLGDLLILVFWGLYFGFASLGNYQIAAWWKIREDFSMASCSGNPMHMVMDMQVARSCRDTLAATFPNSMEGLLAVPSPCSLTSSVSVRST